MIHLLQVLFIGLKLAGNIDWSWWLVMLPYIFYLGLLVLSVVLEELEDRLS